VKGLLHAGWPSTLSEGKTLTLKTDPPVGKADVPLGELWAALAIKGRIEAETICFRLNSDIIRFANHLFPADHGQ
jgi:hypothetical protein